jgi:hypothetical protein
VIIDSDGIVRHASSVTPDGQRDVGELAALCEQIDRDAGTACRGFEPGPGLEPGSVLYVKSRCGASLAALMALDNLHLHDQLPVRNVSEDGGARDELIRLAGKDQAPCLVQQGQPLHDSSRIIQHLAERCTPR